jgi:hypothetical protein
MSELLSSLSTSLGTACAVCGGPTESTLELPGLPLTDTFTRTPVDNPVSGIDQTFRFCEACGHGQLGHQVAPEVLYGSNYCFRTSASPTARKGTDFFMSLLDEVAAGRQFRSAIDLGCNDLFLLDRVGDRAALRTGVDPIWKGREHEMDGQPIRVIGAPIEDVDLSVLDQKPDLVMCRHTLEHIARPRDVVAGLLAGAADDAIFVFEVPGIEALVNRCRFDQVFHQHLQYFSMRSFLKMLEGLGARAIAVKSHYHDWGAFAVAFAKGGDGGAAPLLDAPDGEKMSSRLKVFRSQMAANAELIRLIDGPAFGYGAAQMLPVLAYHMGTDLGFLDAVIDDDPEKEGVFYWNLPVSIRPLAAVGSLDAATVLITAVDSAQPILRRLLERRPRHIIHPFNMI